MSYPFIDLKKATKEELVAHLREQCGVEKDGKKEELVQAILDFESSSGLVRPDMPTGNKSKEMPPADLPKRVRIIIAPSETDNSDVYVGLNDLDILIKRGEEVPYPNLFMFYFLKLANIALNKTKTVLIANTLLLAIQLLY